MLAGINSFLVSSHVNGRCSSGIKMVVLKFTVEMEWNKKENILASGKSPIWVIIILTEISVLGKRSEPKGFLY